ncbi:MAG: phosphomannomutase/phosphoglucomutase [Clostridiales bacterium]|nr:phosphomannomutase/phosphoglucomutase [Clostridiales bacterium]
MAKAKSDLSKLQNGSDIRGIALTGIEGELPNLCADEAIKIARGYLVWLCKKTGKRPDELKIAIGRDPRMSGQSLFHSLNTGMGPYGVQVLDCGIASTPAMFMSTLFPAFECDGAIMITASHLPFNRNGFKFFDKTGGLNREDISEIIETAKGGKKKLEPLGPAVFEDNFFMDLGKKTYPSQPADLMKEYCHHLRKIIIDRVGEGPEPLKGLKIVVDAGNGSGGFYANDVLKPLGADTTNSIFLEPDGTFPNHAPNPEDKDAMAAISMAVLTTGSDLGLIFDTDVDRSSAVDGRGREISRNRIVALAAAIVAEEHPGTTVVTDSITSTQLTEFLERDLGLSHFRFKRGYKNVINKAIQLNRDGRDAQLAIETSGHAALKENYFLDDGAYLATLIVVKAAKLAKEGKTPDSLIENMKDPEEAREVRMNISREDFGPYGDTVLDDLKKWISGSLTDAYAHAKGSTETSATPVGMSPEEPNYEGIRINFDKDNGDGWCLLRKSLHDPLMAMNMESNTKGGCKIISGKMRSFLKNYPDLDISKL